MLQPPFAESLEAGHDAANIFRIALFSGDERMEQAFRSQLHRVLDAWDARIQGEVLDGRRAKRCHIVVSFRDGDSYEIAAPIAAPYIDRCDFEIRVFKLYGKQPGGIAVDRAREYFKEFGGVHVYDGGFRLPYYGIEQDWLSIQRDHSHRRSLSSLLPSDLNVPFAMHDLPTMERLFGTVNISTARELHVAGERARKKGTYLMINIGRDRLVDNEAYQELRRLVRWSIDYYATRYQLRQDREVRALRPLEAPQHKLDRLWETIREIRSDVPEGVHAVLVDQIDDYYDALRNENAYVGRQSALLAPLAAAGLAALAYEHESNRQIRHLEYLLQRLTRWAATAGAEVDDLTGAIQSWLNHHRETRRLFTSLTTTDDRENAQRLRVKPTIDIVLRNTRPLLRGIMADTASIPDDLLLPVATMADWQALFQNVFVNASNAMLDARTKRLRLSAGFSDRRNAYLIISDTGVGVDVPNATALFDPFVRKLEISDERKSLGLGGMGLGLTIVRMICETRRCQYEFVSPEPGFSTSFRMTWTR